MDEKSAVDVATFLKAFTTLLEMYITALAEGQALRDLLTAQGLLRPQEFEAAAQNLRAAMLAQVRAAAPSDGEQLIELLRRFEGPLQ